MDNDRCTSDQQTSHISTVLVPHAPQAPPDLLDNCTTSTDSSCVLKEASSSSLLLPSPPYVTITATPFHPSSSLTHRVTPIPVVPVVMTERVEGEKELDHVHRNYEGKKLTTLLTEFERFLFFLATFIFK
jgi:hypothetical protein